MPSEDARAASRPWHAEEAHDALQRLGVQADVGLDTREAWRRRLRHGLNQIRQRPPKRLLHILLDQLRSLILLLLAVAAAAALSFGHVTESLAIFAVIVLNTLIGFFTELRAVRSMEALRALSVVTVNVRRGGRVSALPAKGLVPGDIVVLEAGDVVSADLRLISASRLQANEAVLTGESLPVSKRVQPVEGDTPLAERTCMAYQGTAISRGSAEGVVVAVGMETELGRIAHLMQQAKPAATPLERRIDQLSRQLMWVALVLAGLIGAAGVLGGRDLLLMLESAIALAVATVPEGLPMVATLALARGMWRMAQRNALIERLSAVETLGATTVILTDKTGTLTRNEMAVSRVLLTPDRDQGVGELAAEAPPTAALSSWDPSLTPLQRLLTVCALCNNASLTGGDAVGDPMEVALLELAQDRGAERAALLQVLPEVREVAFDPAVRMMATVHALGDGRFLAAVKGAPEAVLEHLAGADDAADRSAPLAEWHRAAERLAADGQRMLAVAGRIMTDSQDDPYRGLELFGLLALQDPPRRDVQDAIARCREAGVRVVMVTGDHAATARSIALAVGLAEEPDVTVVEGPELQQITPARLTAPVFARVSPAQKLALIEAFQARGDIVAMIGDGVNDAPALRKADIGVAMGKRGSQIAREAADMVLRDDRLSTTVTAIAQGRAIFGNIRKFLVYLLSCNVSELLVVGLASLAGAPLPLLPLQILYLNLVTDVFPAFALGAGEGERDIMRRPPRDPAEPLLTRRHWRDIVVGASIITTATLVAFWLCLVPLGLSQPQAVTAAFLTLALSQLWHVFGVRGRGTRWLDNEITRNRFVWGAIGLCLVLILLPVMLPGLSGVLSLTRPEPDVAMLSVCCSVAAWLVGQLTRQFGNPDGGQSERLDPH